jgi:hypothetical protein
MWVLTDEQNGATLATYQRAGAIGDRGQVGLVWTF